MNNATYKYMNILKDEEMIIYKTFIYSPKTKAEVICFLNGHSSSAQMNTPPRAQTTVAGRKSGAKIVKRRRNTAKTPYNRSRPRQSPKNTGTKWSTIDFLSDTSRMIAKGAMKFLTFMTDTDYISSSDTGTFIPLFSSFSIIFRDIFRY